LITGALALPFVPVPLGLVLVAYFMRRNLALTVALGLSVVYLAAHWLIEVPCPFVPLTQLVPLRGSERLHTEVALAAWFALGAGYLLAAVAFGRFFL
jgi:hypothetical protein